MTDVMPEQTTDENEDWDGGQSPTATYPDYGRLPEARFSVNFTPGKAPMLTIRAWTASDLTAAVQELEDANTLNLIGVTHSSLNAQVAIGAGLGPTTPVPSAPAVPQAPGAPTPPPFGPNVSVPQAPGYQGPAVPGMPMPPAPPAPGGFGGGQQQGSRGPKPRPAWPQVYKIEVPFQQKDEFKAFREQYKDALKGKVAWAGGGSYWIEGSVAQSFANYNPVPA
jgi:hypothetical protein